MRVSSFFDISITCSYLQSTYSHTTYTEELGFAIFTKPSATSTFSVAFAICAFTHVSQCSSASPQHSSHHLHMFSVAARFFVEMLRCTWNSSSSKSNCVFS